MMTTLIGVMLSPRPPKLKPVKTYEKAGVVLHVFNGGFLDRSEVKSEADFIKSRVHRIQQVPVLREVVEPVKKPKQGKREARRRKRQAKAIAAKVPMQMAA